MEEIISKEKLKDFLLLNGEVRGVILKAYGEFILKEEGEQGLKKLQDALAGLGYPMDYQEMKAMAWFPLGYQAITIEAIQKLFGYNENKFQEIGRFSAKFSLIIRIFMKSFLAKKQDLEIVQKIWRKSYSVGNLEIAEYNEKEKYVICRLKNFRLHPLQCSVLLGYFSTLFQMVRGTELEGEERKCIFRGDEYHEFFIKASSKE